MTGEKSSKAAAKKSAKSGAGRRAGGRAPAREKAALAAGRKQTAKAAGARTQAPAPPPKSAKKAAAKQRAAKGPSRFASKHASKFAARSLACSAAVWRHAGARGRDMDKFLAAKEEWSNSLLGPREGAGVAASSPAPTPAPEQNVVGVGIGEKVVGGHYTGVMTLKFLVRVKYGREQLSSGDQLPESVGGLPTDIEQVGTIRCAQSANANPRGMLRPAPPGSSIGFRDPADPLTAGTFGALVRRGPRRFILSNNHVLVPTSQNDSAIGLPIFQPAPFDAAGSTNTAPVARLSAFVRLHTNQPNLVDCAIAELDTPALGTNSIISIGVPRGVAVAQASAPVEKFGRTTRFSAGTVVGIDDVLVRYPGIGTLRFRDQIRITGRNGQPFSDVGDSGALIVERTTGRAVGLLFAVTPAGVFANHIGDVLEMLRVSLA